jgi:hypothetical protein
MKKVSLLLCFFSGLSMISFAQEEPSDDYKPFRFGLAVQPNISWMKVESDGMESGSPTIKFSYGLLAEFAFSKNYSIATGLQIMTTGGGVNYKKTVYFEDGRRFSGNEVFMMDKRVYSTQYINIPVGLKMKTNEIGYLTYFGTFGLDVGFKTKATGNDYGTPNISITPIPPAIQNANVKHDVSKDVNFFRLALNLGGGVEYGLSGNTSLIASINYSNGFVNVLKSKSDQMIQGNTDPASNGQGPALNQNARSNYVGLTVGVLF